MKGESHDQSTGIVTSYATCEWDMGTYTGDKLATTHDEIAQLAFSLYESPGWQDGHIIDDWLRAEQEFVRHVTAKSRGTNTIHCMASRSGKVNLCRSQN